MAVENGEWIMMGLDADDPDCIRSAEELIAFIDAVGFLPLFRNAIPGFSVEEHTISEDWFTGDAATDPWEWRETITKSRRAAYGKFFDGKAGFVSLDLLPDFINARRDGYDFDARWDDEKASIREKKIMDLFLDTGAELYSPDIRKKAGFGKGGEKGFEGTLTKLQMQFYLCPTAFKQRVNKEGTPYGWSIAVFATPEQIWGEALATSAYAKTPEESARRIAENLIGRYPDATPQQIRKVIGQGTPGEKRKRGARRKGDPYPVNLLKAIDINKEALDQGTPPELMGEMDYETPTNDQLLGLEYAIGLLKENEQEILRLRYEKGLTLRESGERVNLSGPRAGQLCARAIRQLRMPSRYPWYVKGLQACRDERKAQIAKLRQELERRTGRNMRTLLAASPLELDIGYGVCWSLEKAGIMTVGELLFAMQTPNWHEQIPGIGTATARKLTAALKKRGLIDRDASAINRKR